MICILVKDVFHTSAKLSYHHQKFHGGRSSKRALSLSFSHLGWSDTPHNSDNLAHWCVNCVVESGRHCVLSQWNTNIDCSQQGVTINKVGRPLLCMFSHLKTTLNSLINTLDRLLSACGKAPLRQTRDRVPLLLCTKGTTTMAAGGKRTNTQRVWLETF